MHRILDLSASPARLRVAHQQLILQADTGETSVPLDELAVVVVAHPQVSYSHPALVGVLQAGGMFVVCDDKSMPLGMLLPLQTHHTQAEKFIRQAAASRPTRKRLWQSLVQSKILAQAAVLESLHGNDAGLRALVPQVKSDDSSNVEARAARRYWPILFNDRDFRRDRMAPGANALLNYGYAVLRAICARAICAAGLHPGLGLHHHNRYSGFPLADDLMEPLRPLVDTAVVKRLAEEVELRDLTPQVKRKLLEPILDSHLCDGERRTLFDISSRMASSLSDVLTDAGRDLKLPKLFC